MTVSSLPSNTIAVHDLQPFGMKSVSRHSNTTILFQMFICLLSTSNTIILFQLFVVCYTTVFCSSILLTQSINCHLVNSILELTILWKESLRLTREVRIAFYKQPRYSPLCATGSTMFQYFVKVVPTVYKKLNGKVSQTVWLPCTVLQ